ncbi:MAG: phosphatidate cytidylyltransferase [Oligoflexia bacterium]|nr:phosphatidate cytidylyltransferase [Oligoflexia bacterium]
MIKTRVLSAIIAVIIGILLINFGNFAMLALAAFLLSFLALREFGRLTLQGERYRDIRKYFLALGLVCFTVSIVYHNWILHSFIMSTLLVFVLFLLLARDSHYSLEEAVNKAGLSVLGILYAGVCPVYLCLLAGLQPANKWLVLTLFIVFTGDTVAYLVGTRYGKTKLFPRISPKKSVEGSIGSLFASVLVAMIFRHFWLPEVDQLMMLLLSVVTSVVAQLGDLSESLIKRAFHVKDSGSIMPGHGGLLDRFDGVLFGAPIVYVFAKFLVMP